MKAYRRYFIRLNMLLVGAVLLITLVLAGVYIGRSEYTNMRQTMQETLEPFSGQNGTFSFTPGNPKDDPGKKDGQPPEQPRDDPGKKDMQPPEAPEQADSRCVTVFFENGEGTIISGSSKSDSETLLAAADAAVALTESFGRLKAYDLFYLKSGMAESAKVCLYSAKYLRTALIRMSLYLLAAFLLTLLACYLISRHISKIAIRPVQQSMDREKQFVADISHDLKTPMAVMQSCGNIIRENPAQTVAEAQPWLERSEAAMQNMKSLIDDMLTLSAVDTAQRLPKHERVDFSAVVTKAALEMDVMAYDRGIELTADVQDGLSILGDADALLRIVTGLIENALKYEPQNGKVEVTLAERGKAKVLTVRNFGATVAPEDLPHLFERFYRGDKARTAQQGHGLGLAIIHRTVELMNGSIEVESAPETGTSFTVTLM